MHLEPLTVKRVSLIFVAALLGSGTKEDPERTAFFYYNDDGEMMACYDPIFGPPDSPSQMRRKSGVAPNAELSRRASGNHNPSSSHEARSA